LLAQSNGQTQAGANLSQALSLIAMARADVAASEASLATIASYSYSQRGEAYVTSFMQPLSLEANATIRMEQSFQANLTQFQASYSAYSSSQATAAAKVTSSLSALATAISQVNTGTAASSINASQVTAAALKSDMAALLSIPGIAAISTLIADIHASSSSASSFDSARGMAESQSGAYEVTSIPSFSAYFAAMNSDGTAVQSAGSAYVSAYQKAMGDLNVPTILSIPGVQAIYNNLAGLQVSGTVSDVDSALQVETSAMASVQSYISSSSSVVETSGHSITLSGTLNATASSLLTRGRAFLNVTTSAALAQSASLVKSEAQTALSFVEAANSSLQTNVGAFPASANSVATAGASLSSVTRASSTAVGAAVGYVKSDIQFRTSEAASGRAEISQALQLFSRLNVSGGVAALAQAGLELQEVSALSA
jgi:hypothetical protein